MALSYEGKQRVKKWMKILAIILGVLLVLCAARFIYVQRFLVYDENGVHLDYSHRPEGGIRHENADGETEYPLTVDKSAAVSGAGQSRGFLGVSLTATELMSEEGREKLRASLGGVSVVMLDMKTTNGKFLYETALSGGELAETDIAAIAGFVEELSSRAGLTLIARVPAFRDSAFALSDFSQALAISGGALWLDEHGGYRLDPAGSKVTEYLLGTARELAALGFDEVVFDDFRFPESANIRYTRETDGKTAAQDCAKALSQQAALYGIAVSFASDDAVIVSLGSRVYLTADDGSEAAGLAETYASHLGENKSAIVFMTTSHDTRFREYSILSPVQ